MNALLETGVSAETDQMKRAASWLVDKEVRRLDMENGKVVAETPVFAEIGERIRDIRAAPDGSICILTDGSAGDVLRVTAE